jgi:hypothetical protein
MRKRLHQIHKEGFLMKKKLLVGLVTMIMMLSMMVSPALAATSYDAFAQFDTTSATGANVPWLYNTTTDEGATFTPCTVLEAQDKLQPWHPFAGNWTGVGLNGDIADYVELNADTAGGSYGALSFKAPEDGTYAINVNALITWDQAASTLHARLNGTDLFTLDLASSSDLASAVPATYEQTGVALKAGEEVFFFCPSPAEGSWISCYTQVVVTKEEAAAEETTATDTAATTDVPKTGVVGLGLLFGAGAVITGAFSLKRKDK